jgi:hypothetical protein
MHAADAQRIETGMGYTAAASFAAAVGYAVFQAIEPVTDFRGMVVAGGIVAMAAYPAAQLLLRILEGRPKPFPQPVFDIVKIEPVGIDELLLTESDRLHSPEDTALQLEDVLVEVAPDSRVVQLFDPAAMPTAGQLKARIDRHLEGGTSHSPPPDASEALFAALADLRRSLR